MSPTKACEYLLPNSAPLSDVLQVKMDKPVIKEPKVVDITVKPVVMKVSTASVRLFNSVQIVMCLWTCWLSGVALLCSVPGTGML